MPDAMEHPSETFALRLHQLGRGVVLLVWQKGGSIAKAAINDVISGLATQALVLLIISVVALAVAILWPLLFRRPKAFVPNG